MRRRLTVVMLALFVGIFLLAGCGKQEERNPQVIKVVSGDAQTGLPGAQCGKDLIILVQGAHRKGLLGGQGKREAAVGVKMRVTPMTEGAKAEPIEDTTDAGGNFRCRLTLANKFGDQYFKVECADFEEVKPIYVHAIAGVQVTGGMQETLAGDVIQNPIQISLTDERGAAIVGEPVYFTIKSGGKKAKLSAARVLSDWRGKVSVSLETDGDYTGAYEILAEVGDGERRTRGIVIRTLGISRMSIVIGILGGLGIFIFGMTLMSDGLQQIAGDRLKAILQLFTGNRFYAMLAGLGVTAVIQSSGACTVMVVGFVNAQLLNLTQALGIILGASIGTTVTAQMVSFKLDALALPTIAVGVLCTLIAKRSQAKGIAATILGFGLLFYGMMFMSSQMKAIAEFPTFISFFSKFDCTPAAGGYNVPMMSIIGAILVGIVMTVIVQSSSATVGIAIAMADSGLLNYYTAIPLIIGDNIGAAITGILGSLNTSRTSQQAAMGGTVFKVLSGIIMLPLYYITWDGVPCFHKLIDLITAGDVFAPIPENLGRHLASAHTLFNIISVAVFLPFTDFIIWLTRFILPDKVNDKKDNKIIYPLEQRLLNTPSAALGQVLYALTAMAEAAVDLTQKAVSSVIDMKNAIEAETVGALECRIDNTQHAIIDYLVMLTRRNLNISQSNSIPIFMHCVNDVERIGDRAVNIYELMPDMKHKEIQFSPSAISEIQEISNAIHNMESNLLRGLHEHDMKCIQNVILMDAEVKRMTARFEHSHEDRLKLQDCTVEKGVIFLELLSNLERISAHLNNVAERAQDILPHGVNFKKNAAPSVEGGK